MPRSAAARASSSSSRASAASPRSARSSAARTRRASTAAAVSSRASTCCSCARSRRRAATTGCSRSSSGTRTQKASRGTGPTGENLLRMLETRLDNVVYRLGFAGSRAQARQLVRHGHFLVNGRRVNIPSYGVRPDDVISLQPGSPAETIVRDATDLTAVGHALAPGRPRRAHRQDAQVARARRDRHARPGIPDRRALLEVTRAVTPCFAPDRPRTTRKDHMATRSSLMEFQMPEDRLRGRRRALGAVHDRAARPRLRLHVRQLAAARAALLARGRGGDRRQDRGRRARVHDAAGRARGRHRHHPQPQEPRLPAARRVARDRGARLEEGRRRRHGRRHRGARRPRDPQPGARARAPRRQGQARDDAHDRPRPRLRPRRARTAGRRRRSA